MAGVPAAKEHEVFECLTLVDATVHSISDHDSLEVSLACVLLTVNVFG